MYQISKRLETIASCVPAGSTVADIGTDHAYMPIYLIQNSIASHVIAMDVNKGPLKKAETNVEEAGVRQSIDLRLSDGLAGLKHGEADVITISGMGGKLIEKILTDGQDVIMDGQQFVLSPQSEIMHFRKFLEKRGFCTDNEKMVEEDGKYYVIICCHYDAEYEIRRYAQLLYGEKLIEQKDPVLLKMLAKELESYRKVKAKVEASNSVHAVVRLRELARDIEAIEYVIDQCVARS
jgi:tRNA (adenine22-N1)-methyltransferase